MQCSLNGGVNDHDGNQNLKQKSIQMYEFHPIDKRPEWNDIHLLRMYCVCVSRLYKHNVSVEKKKGEKSISERDRNESWSFRFIALCVLCVDVRVCVFDFICFKILRVVHIHPLKSPALNTGFSEGFFQIRHQFEEKNYGCCYYIILSKFEMEAGVYFLRILHSVCEFICDMPPFDLLSRVFCLLNQMLARRVIKN